MPDESNKPPVVVKDLHKSFDGKMVLDGVNLTVEHGQTVAIMGRSGTGKSVLLRLLICLQPADSGVIQLLGQDVTHLDQEPLNEIRKKIGFLFQQGALYDSLTVQQNVEFPLKRHTKLSDSERKDKARQLLSSVGLEEGDTQKLPSQISGGMQKRVGLARALALAPEILLCDEPTSGLDPITAQEVGALISKLQKERKMTSVIVTHDVHGARAFADRLVMIDKGKVVTEGTFDDLQKSRDELVASFLRDAA